MRFVAVLIAAVLVCISASAETDQEKWQAGVSMYTDSGDYGSDSTTSTFYMPFTLRRLFEPGTLELTIPYISVTTTGNVVIIGGTPNGTKGRGHVGGASGASSSRVTHSGLGDIIFKGRYYAIDEKEWFPSVSAVARVKFPTASHSDGLGTGKFDEGFDLEFSKTIQKRYLALGDVGYTFIGSPSDIDLHNQWNFSLGGGYYIFPEKLLATLTYEEYEAVVDGESDPKDLLLEADYMATRQLRFQAGVQVGLTESTADYGFNLGVRYKF